MVWNDTSLRQGLVQDMEDICGLGATGITSSTSLFQQFTRWSNQWAKTGATIAIKAMDGFDFDDPAWTTFPSGTYPYAQLSGGRTIVFDGSLKLLKIKTVAVAYDGTHFVKADPADSSEFENVKADSNIDSYFLQSAPKYDPKSNACDIYPKLSAGGVVYVEFFREPKEFATTGTDTQEPGFASPFHKLISLGASFEYCKLYRPELAATLRVDLYGNGGNIPGLLEDMKRWYASRYPRPKRMKTYEETHGDSNR